MRLLRTLAPVVLNAVFPHRALAYDNSAPGARLPVLGWSSWVDPGDEHPIFDYCDEHSVKAASDAFVSLGFKPHYTHFHLDDCWLMSTGTRPGTYKAT